ncbi:MAG: InlB B-repeat-containing protein, partial [Lachnospiraceae bacterium]|nr:InlB B-repeat-containing protein [Lachnospiraceae bacterium]
MYRRLISGMLAAAMTFQMCAGAVHAAGKTGHTSSQPADIQLLALQDSRDSIEETAAEANPADLDTETNTDVNAETSADGSIETNIETSIETNIERNTETSDGINTETSADGSIETSTETDTESETKRSTESETETAQEPGTEFSTADPSAGSAESKPPTASADISGTDDSEEEAYEEGNPDFLFQAGGFRVMDSPGDGRRRSRASETNEDGVNQLSEGDMDRLASELYTALKNRDATIEVRAYGFYNDNPADTQQLLMLYYAVVNDHPDLYYVRTGYKKSYLTSSKLITKISPNYYIDIDDNAFQEGVQRAKEAVSADMDDLQTAIALHDYIVLNCEYDKERLADGTIPAVSYGAYGVLANQIAVCQGYALAYKYLLNEFGINSYIVTSDKMNHAWNIVEIDGALYQVDATWDDPTWDKPGQVRHSYMFQSDEEFQKSYYEHSSHHDWYVTKGSGIVDIQADGTAYDNAFWKTVRSPLVYDNSAAGGQYYYVTEDKRLEGRTYHKDTEGSRLGEAVTLLTLETPYSGLALDGSRLYYNNKKTISYIDVAAEECDSVIRYALAEGDQDNIYGFTKDKNTIYYAKRASYNISGNSPVYSFDDAKTYTVTFQDAHGAVLETRRVAEGSYAAPPAGLEIPEGYVFARWEGNYSSVMQDETVTAVYTPISYVITYELEEGINPPGTVEEYTVETALCLAVPIRTGYDFEGWYTDAQYHEQVTAIEQGTTGDVTFYAKWSPAQYQITYELGGRADNTANPAQYTVASDTIHLAAPERAGYMFNGWFAEPARLIEVTEIPAGSTGDRSFYAKWTAIPYRITYELNEGINSPENPVKYDADTEELVLYAPTRAHYNFEGWFADDRFEQKVECIRTGSIGDVTLYAKWVRKPVYEVRFFDGEGKLLAASSIEEGDSAAAPAQPDAEDGYRFEKWDGDYTNVQKSLDIKAVFSPIVYHIDYELNGAVDVGGNPDTYTIESAEISLEAPRHGNTNLAFSGWYCDKMFQKRITSIKQGSTGNLTVYAKWVTAWPVNIGTTDGLTIEEIAVPYKKGKVQKPVPTVLWNGRKLANRKDFTVMYTQAPSEVGRYEVLITGKGDFTGTAKTTLRVVDTSSMTSMSKVKVAQKIHEQIYTAGGNRLDEEMVVLKHGASQLAAGTDYEFVQHEYKGAGTYYVPIRGTGEQYVGEITTKFQIKPRPIDDSAIEVWFEQQGETQPYEKDGAQPKVVLCYGGEILSENIDYTLSYKNNKKIGGTATVTVKGKNNFSGKRTLTYTVGRGRIETVSVTVPDQVVSSKKGGFVSVPVLTDTNGKKLRAGKDYDSSIIYKCGGKVLDRKKDKLPAGAEVTVELAVIGRGSYAGTRNVTAAYKIFAADKKLSKAKVTLNHKQYFTGSSVTLAPDDLVVTVGGVVLSKNYYDILPD